MRDIKIRNACEDGIQDIITLRRQLDDLLAGVRPDASKLQPL